MDKLKSLGREVEYVVFDDEGHGFTKRTNELKAYGLAAEWLEQAPRSGPAGSLELTAEISGRLETASRERLDDDHGSKSVPARRPQLSDRFLRGRALR